MMHRTGHPLVAALDAWAAEDPGAVAVLSERTSTTVGQVHEAAARLAGWLAARGVGPGDRVLVQLANGWPAVAAVHGIARLGAVLVPARPGLRGGEIRRLVVRTGAVAAVVPDVIRRFDHRTMIVSLLPDLPTLRHVLVVGERGRGLEPFGLQPFAAIRRCPRHTGPPPSADDPLAVLFAADSADTTDIVNTRGKAPGCVHNGHTLDFAGRLMGQVMGVGADDVLFPATSLLRLTGILYGLLVPAQCRVPVVLPASREPRAARELMARYGVSSVVGSAAFGRMLLNPRHAAGADLSGLRRFGLAGSPTSREMNDLMRARLGARLVSAFVCPEGLIVAATAHAYPPDRPGERGRPAGGACPAEAARPGEAAGPGGAVRSARCVGRGLPGVVARVVDPAGVDVPVGVEGRVVVGGPGRLVSWWDDALAAPSVRRPGPVVPTGHRGYLDGAGRLHLTGPLGAGPGSGPVVAPSISAGAGPGVLVPSTGWAPSGSRLAAGVS